MLEWCRNLQLNQPLPNQYTSTTSHPQTKKYRKLNPQSSRNQVTSIMRSTDRKGIKTHFNRSLKQHKHTQTAMQVAPTRQLISTSTQTLQVFHYQLVLPPQNHIIYTPRHPPPQLHYEKQPNYYSKPTYQSNLFSTLQHMQPRQNEYKNDQRRQTKASYNLIQSQQPLTSTQKTSEFIFKNAQSIHVPLSRNNTSRIETIGKTRFPHKLYTFCIEESDSIKSPLKSEKPFSEKYKDMLKNVQSQLKNYQKKHSQKRFRAIPQPQILLYDRKTLISKHNESNGQSSRQIAIEESFVIEPSIKQLFVSIRTEVYQDYSLSIWGQVKIGMCVSCKEVPITSMKIISAQLLIYKQLETQNIRIESILQLYQSQIDNHSYMFIKQPFTQNLAEYAQSSNQQDSIVQSIFALFKEIQRYGLYLRVEPKMQDFVVCFNQIKIHNLQILQFQQKDSLPINQQTLAKLINQMQT